MKSSYILSEQNRSSLQGQQTERQLGYKLFSKFQFSNTRKLRYDQSIIQIAGQIPILVLQHKSRVTF